jgi:parallel beta-helix repeat protein
MSRRVWVASRVLPVALLASVARCDVAVAHDLHVAGTSATASDANAGTRQRPLRTISAAVSRAMPGDTIWVQSGTYRETIRFPRSGEGPDRPIRVTAAPGAEVVIKGSDVVTGWVPVGSGMWKKMGWRVNSQQVFADGKPLQQIGPTSPFHEQTWDGQPVLRAVGRGLSDVTPGSFFYDASSATLYVRLGGDADPNSQQMEASVRDAVVESGSAGFIELRDLRFSHSNTSAIPAMRGIVNIEGNGWVVTGCSFTDGDFAGLSVSGEGHRILGNVANRNGNVGIAINGSDAAHDWAPYPGRPPQDIVLERNVTSFNNTRGFNWGFQAGGVKAANSCRRVRVSRHVAASNAGVGIWFDLGCRDVKIERSVVTGNLVGIEYEISDAARITHNLAIGNSKVGIFVSASSDVTVSNNTLDRNGEFGIVVHGMPRSEHPRLRDNAIRDNIVADSRVSDIVVHSRAPHATGNTSDHNLFHRREGGVKITWTESGRYGVTHEDLRALWRSTGQERHSRTGDPRWVDPSSGDYRLGAGSPAIGAGSREATEGDLGAFPHRAERSAAAPSPARGGPR